MFKLSKFVTLISKASKAFVIVSTNKSHCYIKRDKTHFIDRETVTSICSRDLKTDRSKGRLAS